MSVGIPFVERTASNNTVLKFRKLTPYDRAEILARDRRRRRAASMQDMQELGLDKGEIIGTLRQFDAEVAGPVRFGELIDDEQGRADIFDLSARTLIKVEAGEVTWITSVDFQNMLDYSASLDSSERMQLIADICSIETKTEDTDAYDDPEVPADPNSQAVTIPPLT